MKMVMRKTILTFGPVAIDPAFQRQGFGKQLMEVSMKRAAELGYDTIVILAIQTTMSSAGLKVVKSSTFGLQITPSPPRCL